MPISGLVVTFQSPVSEHIGALKTLRLMPEVDIGDAIGCKLAVVIDSPSKRRDQELWDSLRELPGVVDIAVAMIAFDQPDGDQANCNEIDAKDTDANATNITDPDVDERAVDEVVCDGNGPAR